MSWCAFPCVLRRRGVAPLFDEHRVGLKPILKKVWSPIGIRPKAIVQHQYEWLYVYGFVEPRSGKTLWYLIPRVNTQWMNVVLKTFATEAGADQDLIVLLVQDRAGWHRSQKVNLPARIETEFLPAYSPECDASHLTFAEQRHGTRMHPRLPNDYGHYCGLDLNFLI